MYLPSVYEISTIKLMVTLPNSLQNAKQNGFTLLEIVISVGLLALLFGFYNLMVETVLFTNRGRFDDIGRSVAVEQLEIARSIDFGLLDNGSVAISDDDLDLLPQGSGTMVVADYGSADSGIKEVVVSVNWVDRGITRDVTLTTLITDGGVGK